MWAFFCLKVEQINFIYLFEGVPNSFLKGKQTKNFKLLYMILFFCFFFFLGQGGPETTLDWTWRHHWRRTQDGWLNWEGNLKLVIDGFIASCFSFLFFLKQILLACTMIVNRHIVMNIKFHLIFIFPKSSLSLSLSL